MKKNNSTSIVINVNGNNNVININDYASKKTSKKKKSFKTWLKALGKLIRSIFVNISVLLIEIFAKLG